MTTVDIFFLVVLVASLGIMLLSSPAIRAIAWDTLRHPFTKATITVNDDRIEIRHDTPADKASPLTSSGSR